MPHSSGGGGARGGTPLFLTKATRRSDGATYYIGVNYFGTYNPNGQPVFNVNEKDTYSGILTADMFPAVNTFLDLGNGSYIKCTAKNNINTTVIFYTYDNQAVGAVQMYSEVSTTSTGNVNYDWTLSVGSLWRRYDNPQPQTYDEYIKMLQTTDFYFVALQGIYYFDSVHNPPPTNWNFRMLNSAGSSGKTDSTFRNNLLKFWGRENPNNPNMKNEILPGDYTGDTSTPNVPDSNYPDISNNDDTDFTDTDNLISVSDMGAIHLYSPTFVEMNAFHNYLWSTDFLQNWDAQLKKLFGSPEQQIIALLAIYANIPLNSGTTSIILGNISSDVQSATIAKQYITVDCGEVEVPRIWGNFLDFEPYTTISIYLPFISTVDLTANEIVGKKLHLKYNIDVLTGACVAQLQAIDEKAQNIILNVSGNCGVQIPWNSANYNQLVSNGITAVAGLGATVLSGGLAPVIASGSIANAVGELAQIGVDTADNVFSGASPRFSRGGSFNTNNGVLCDKIPHLLITRPIQSFAQNYNKYNGYPSNITEKIGNLQGFTKIDKINLSGISATAEEIEQITTLLKSGIIIT